MKGKASAVKELIPTRLLEPSEREPLPIVQSGSYHFRFLKVLFIFFRLYLGDLFLRLKGKKTRTLRKERIIRILQRLGMLWIRVAQAWTLRGDWLCDSLGMNLMDLKDRGGVEPFAGIKQVVEKELEQPISSVFAEFEEIPFAASTVSQTHRAKLLNEQVWTAVKVQRPQADEIFERDLRLFRRIIRLLKFFSIRTSMRWDELVYELKEVKVRELNYYYEAAALETLEKNLRNQPVHVPFLFREYCRQRLLVSEFIQGALLSDCIQMQKQDPERLEAWLEINNIDFSLVARRLFHSTYKQVFEDNFFHGDMNTGNIILMKDSHIAVIECRSAGSLEMESLEKQKMFLRSLADGEYIVAAEIYFLLASRLPRVDLNTVKDRLVRVWRIWETRVHVKNLPYAQKSLAYMTGCVNRVVHDSQFAPLWSFVKLTTAWVHLDNSISGLSPDFNYLKQLRIYFRHARQRETIDKIRQLPSRLARSMEALHQVPQRTAEYSLFKESIMRRQAQVVQGSASKMDAVLAAGFGFISFFLLVIAGFLAVVFAIRHLHLRMDFLLGPQLNWLASHIPDMDLAGWILLFTAYGFLYFFFRNQKRHFQLQEFGNHNNHTGWES